MASVTEAQSAHPRFDKLVSKVDKGNVTREVSDIKFLERTTALSEKLKKQKAEFKKNDDKKEEVQKQRKDLEETVAQIVVLEEDLANLKEKKLIKEADEKSTVTLIENFKTETEGLLEELDKNEALVAKAEAPKLPELPAPTKEEPVKVEEPKKEEPKVDTVAKEDPKKEEPVKVEPAKVEPTKTEEPKKEEPKADTVAKEDPKKDGKKEEDCKDGKDKVLTKPVEDLVAQNQLMMQQMMMMNQMTLMMLQQFSIYQMQQHMQNQGPVNQQAYQYAPQNQGGWVFQPSGGQRPGLYPDQMGQPGLSYQNGYNGWGLSPQNYFPDPRFTPMQPNPGQFGPSLGYNMSMPMQQPMFQQPMMSPMGQAPMGQPLGLAPQMPAPQGQFI